MLGIKKYIVYRTPIGTVLVDWNDTLWKYGYPLFPKHCCQEVTSGYCLGGRVLIEVTAKMRKRYGILMSPQEEAILFEQWKVQERKRGGETNGKC